MSDHPLDNQYDLDQIEGEFDAINCVGVLHHMLEPIRGIKALASKLAPGGILHIFVYAAIGCWEISLMHSCDRAQSILKIYGGVNLWARQNLRYAS